MRTVLGLIIAIALGYGVFALFPGLDLAVTARAFDGTGFWVQQDQKIENVRLALYMLEDSMAFVTLALAVFAGWRHRAILRLAARDWFYGFCVFALGPGLLVNVIIKQVWGRARPWRVTEFGGDLRYSQPWQISDQCTASCSFVSGEMAGATALALVAAMVLRANRRVMGAGLYTMGVALAAAVPVFTAWQRIASGKHFLSDVVFAALFVALLSSLLSLLFYGRGNPLRTVDIQTDSP